MFVDKDGNVIDTNALPEGARGVLYQIERNFIRWFKPYLNQFAGFVYSQTGLPVEFYLHIAVDKELMNLYGGEPERMPASEYHPYKFNDELWKRMLENPGSRQRADDQGRVK